MLRRMPIRAEVSFVNLIDVMLVLLIIFMITAPTMHQMMDIDLPESKHSDAKITEGIVISVDDKGVVYIDSKPVEEGVSFAEAIKPVYDERSGEPIFVNAHENAPYGDVINIIGILKTTGWTNVGLVVAEEEGTE